MERDFYGRSDGLERVSIPEGQAFVNISLRPYDRNGYFHASCGERHLKIVCLIMPSGLAVVIAPLLVIPESRLAYCVSEYLDPKMLSTYAIKWATNWSRIQERSGLTVIQVVTDCFRFPSRFLTLDGVSIKKPQELLMMDKLRSFSIETGFPIPHEQILHNPEKRFPVFTI